MQFGRSRWKAIAERARVSDLKLHS